MTKHSFKISSKSMVFIVIILFVGSGVAPSIYGNVDVRTLNNENYCEIIQHDTVIEKVELPFVTLEQGMLDNSPATKTVTPVNNSLPDLVFIELCAWWGSLNTTGIFVDYDVNNSGETYYSNEPIVSNLSFFADDNTTSFDYVLQSPLFYPSTWYEGEILGGCCFFEMDEKPDTITAKIDFTNLIAESVETNNDLTISVPLCVTISGTVYKKEKNKLIPFEGLIELNQFDEDSLSDFGYRHYWSDENGRYNMSLCPKDPLDEMHIYSIMACAVNENLKMMKKSQMVKSGENTTLNFLFEGLPPNKPNTPFGRISGRINRTYTFFSSNVDPDGDNLFYKFRWGDGSYSDWLGPYSSGGKIWANHEWSKPERYLIGVISKDSHGTLSKWSDFVYFSAYEHFSDYKQLSNSLLFRFLENTLDHLPFLQHRFSTNVFN